MFIDYSDWWVDVSVCLICVFLDSWLLLLYWGVGEGSGSWDGV